MALKKVSKQTNENDKKWIWEAEDGIQNPMRPLKRGAKIIGYFIGMPTISTEYGERKVVLIQPKDADYVFPIFTTAVLERAMSEVPVGCYTEIECLGKVKGKKARYWDFEVAYDDEDCISTEEV